VPNFVSEPTNGHDAPLTADLISIGTLERRKNHQYLLHVLARTKAMGHSYRLTLVGEGPLRGKLIALARALGISEQIDFAGYVPAAAALIRRHRLYVHAARMETLGIALIEALAAARPVCAAPVGGVPEVITDGVEGKFWDLEDPEGGARAVIAILSDEGLYARMSAAARARYEADFATEIVAPRLLQALGRGVRVTEPAGGRVSR
jgi:glycosyltransferase involved in cell wall biosynthesis